jgi:hypothetical protein
MPQETEDRTGSVIEKKKKKTKVKIDNCVIKSREIKMEW